MRSARRNFPNIFNPEDFMVLEPPPPPFLYKYMVADRVVDVLEGGMVRFTHLLDTNDSFEVRKTFNRFAGPRFIDALKRAATTMLTSEYFEKKLQQKIAEAGGTITTSDFKKMVTEKLGVSIEEYMLPQMNEIIDFFAETVDSFKTPEEFLTEIGSILLCFSLSERCDIAAMWAHYAGNHTGLVVEFDTSHAWFQTENDPTASKLQKIKYLDRLNDELLEDLQAAFSSKATDWAYEREWRINCSMKQIEKTIDLGAEKIHLRSFPPEAVTSVIVGARASEETVTRVRDVLVRRYHHATLRQATPQRMSGSYILKDI